MPRIQISNVYTAGFFDGEGSVSIVYYRAYQKRNSTQKNYFYWNVLVRIVNTNKQILEDLKAKYGGSINAKKRQRELHRQCWNWVLASQRAVKFLKAIKPYTRIKREHINIALAFSCLLRKQDSRHRHKPTGGWLCLSVNQNKERAILAQQLYDLNMGNRRMRQKPNWGHFLEA